MLEAERYCVMMGTLVAVWLHIKAVCQSVREATTACVDNAASPDWQTLPNGIVNLREVDHHAKTTGRTLEVY